MVLIKAAACFFVAVARATMQQKQQTQPGR
jgi:hypothetical protein